MVQKNGGKLTRAGTSSLAAYDEELAAAAAAAAGQEDSTALGTFISLRGGQMTFNDAPIPGNKIGVVILDAILENVYYEGKFDANEPQSPQCFAFGRDEASMAPHEAATKPQHETCRGCERNEWGTADHGRGKACRNVRRLAIISAGQFNENTGKFEPNPDPEHYAQTPVAYLKLPVTSVRGFAAYVKQIAGALKLPPFGVYTKIELVPDAKTQFKVVFAPVDPIPRTLLSVVMARAKGAAEGIAFPYISINDEDRAPAQAARSKAAAKTAPARGRAAAPAARPAARKF